MNPELKPYPAYRDSGVPWLGEVPEHWEARRLASCLASLQSGAREQTEIDADEGVPNFGGEHVGADGQLLLKNMRFVSRAFVQKLHKGKIKENDILLVKDGATIGKVALLKRMPYAECTVNEHVFILRAASNCLPGLLYQVLRSQAVQNLIWQQVTGSAQPGLNSTFTKGTTIALPPLSEQSAIVRYLDYMDRRIQRYIRAKQKLIKLLEEQKQAIIHQAVTGRIDVRTGKPYPAYKPSGVEWLGDVPEHWEIRRIGSISTRVTKGTTPTSIGMNFVDHGIRFIKVESISKNLGLVAAMGSFIDRRTDALLARSRLHSGDVLVAIAGAIGRVAIVSQGDLPANCNQAVAVISPRNSIVSSRWVAHLLESPAWQRIMVDRSVQSAQANLSLADLRAVAITIPPVREQDEIVSELEGRTKNLTSVVTAIEDGIMALREYRTRLISDVVTGKLDVREAAANLPDELEEELLEDQEQEEETDEDLEDEEQTGDEE